MTARRIILPPSTIKTFQKKVYHHYTHHHRDLPWRKTRNPYCILVAEVMLQQTQVDRVIDKYTWFIKQFSALRKLATAPTKTVVQSWSGLGYNRRALSLQKAAQEITTKYHGQLPSSQEELCTLPGIGPATAAAIRAYAFNQPAVFIETNIRTVFIHTFFTQRKKVKDEEILPLVAQTLDTKNPRQWYNALMDYGAMLKKQYPNPSRKSSHHTRQTPFEGSRRQLRGKILKTLIDHSPVLVHRLARGLAIEKAKVTLVLKKLEEEGFLKKEGRKIYLR